MKTNSYHFDNARFSYNKFAKIKSYLPVTDSVFFWGAGGLKMDPLCLLDLEFTSWIAKLTD